MAYNVFKRPMFRKGGTPAQGTGIMSHVEPRSNFAFGNENPRFINRGGGQPKPTTPRVGPRMLPPNAPSTYGPQVRPMGVMGALGRFAIPFAPTAGLAYLNRAKTQPQLDYMRSMSQDLGMSGEAATEDQLNEYFSESERLSKTGKPISFSENFSFAVDENTPPSVLKLLGTGESRAELKRRENIGTTDDTGITDYTYDDEERKQQSGDIASILEQLKTQEKPAGEEKPVGGDKPTGGDKPADKDKPTTFDSIYQGEVGKLQKAFGKNDDTKALLALALSEAIGTPGSIAEKSKVLNKYLFKIKGDKKKDQKEIAKLAYSATKTIEAAKISAGKQGYSEKLSNELRGYQGTLNDPKASKQSKNYAREQISSIGNVMKVLNPKKEGLSTTDQKMLVNFAKTAQKLQRQPDKNSEAYKKALREYLTNRTTVLQFLPTARTIIAQSDQDLGIGKKDGGRIGFSNGSPIEQIKETETITTSQTPTAQVSKLSFEELKNKLPKEITDDVISLIADSEAALQDFAYIRTQGDVNKFNEKYGVSLVLPATA
tara:strand:+ start:794 stop:2425 length:1632 start_codon:yes stop_codon:yes gene_type:complete